MFNSQADASAAPESQPAAGAGLTQHRYRQTAAASRPSALSSVVATRSVLRSNTARSDIDFCGANRPLLSLGVSTRAFYTGGSAQVCSNLA
eukprot:6182280-Pleurochrysis_carterae.AAC.3